MNKCNSNSVNLVNKLIVVKVINGGLVAHFTYGLGGGGGGGTFATY